MASEEVSATSRGLKVLGSEYRQKRSSPPYGAPVTAPADRAIVKRVRARRARNKRARRRFIAHLSFAHLSFAHLSFAHLSSHNRLGRLGQVQTTHHHQHQDQRRPRRWMGRQAALERAQQVSPGGQGIGYPEPE